MNRIKNKQKKSMSNTNFRAKLENAVDRYLKSVRKIGEESSFLSDKELSANKIEGNKKAYDALKEVSSALAKMRKLTSVEGVDSSFYEKALQVILKEGSDKEALSQVEKALKEELSGLRKALNEGKRDDSFSFKD